MVETECPGCGRAIHVDEDGEVHLIDGESDETDDLRFI